MARRRPDWRVRATLALLLGSLLVGCESTQATVILGNAYPPSVTPLVLYQAAWQAVPFATPLLPGASAAPEMAIPTSGTTAYVVLAPGWAGTAPPSSFIVLQSTQPLSVGLHETLRIAVENSAFRGNCEAGSFLTQQEANFITQVVFPSIFAGLSYDAATCTTAPINDAGGP